MAADALIKINVVCFSVAVYKVFLKSQPGLTLPPIRVHLTCV